MDFGSLNVLEYEESSFSALNRLFWDFKKEGKNFSDIVLTEFYKNLLKRQNLKEIFSYLKEELYRLISLENVFGLFLWKKHKWSGELFIPEETCDNEKKRIKKTLLNLLKENLNFKKPKSLIINYFPNESHNPKLDEKRLFFITLQQKEAPEKIGIVAFQLKNCFDESTKIFLKKLIHDVEHYLWLLISYNLLRKENEKDYLTSLYNRQKLDEKLKEEIIRHKRYNQPLSIIMMDIDHFKKINDKHGHQIGDMILKEVGDIIRKKTRSTDIPARYGGEEFCIILPHTDLAQALTMAERLRKIIKNRKFGKNGKKLNITVSMGVATLNGESNIEELVKKADKALYKAKSQGRNKVVCWESKS